MQLRTKGAEELRIGVRTSVRNICLLLDTHSRDVSDGDNCLHIDHFEHTAIFEDKVNVPWTARYAAVNSSETVLHRR